jgi:hypothetical protein
VIMSEAFKAGDPVRLCNPQPWGDTAPKDLIGKKLIVSSCDGGFLALRDARTGKELGGWYKERFERVAEAPSSDAEHLVELVKHWVGIGPKARELLVSIAGRLAKGHAEHGDFAAVEALDLRKETTEELLDAVVYLSVRLQQEAAKR